MGSYGNSDLIDGTFDQDYVGGAVVHEDSNAISLFGNAWKAYKLCDTIEITKSTFLEFEFKVFEEAEGHAICLEEGELFVILPLPLQTSYFVSASALENKSKYLSIHPCNHNRSDRGYIWWISHSLCYVSGISS